MKILITGASGYLGSCLADDLSQLYEIIGTSRKKTRQNLLPMDITKEDEVIKTFNEVKPDVIIHCVGISGKFNQDPSQATIVNVEGTRNIINGAREIGASVIYISSTAVFNGQDGPFKEEDEPISTDIYAQTKIEAERIVRTSGLRHVIIRPSLIIGNAPYGIEDKFPGQLMRAIMTNTPIEIDNEWLFAPSYNHHISQVINWWLNNQETTSLLHVTSPEVTTKYQFAQRLGRELGIDISIFRPKDITGHSGDNILDANRLIELGAPIISLDQIVADFASEIRTGYSPEGVYKRSKEG